VFHVKHRRSGLDNARPVRHCASMTTRADLLEVLEEARQLGALGPGPVEDHVAHAQGFIDALVGVHGRVLDLGSGGGIPGFVIAAARPDLHLTLIDAQARRVSFLDDAIARLFPDGQVDARHGRAETLARHDDLHGECNAVTARSFGPPAVVAECAVGFLVRGGRLLVSEPPEATARWPTAPLSILGFELGERLAGIQVLTATGEGDPRYPRRDGMPTKRPLF